MDIKTYFWGEYDARGRGFYIGQCGAYITILAHDRAKYPELGRYSKAHLWWDGRDDFGNPTNLAVELA